MAVLDRHRRRERLTDAEPIGARGIRLIVPGLYRGAWRGLPLVFSVMFMSGPFRRQL